MSPPYLPICGISMPFQANLYVPSLNLQNEFSLLCARTAHETVGSVQYFFHARCVIFKMSVYSRVIAGECGGNRDAHSWNEKGKNIYFMLSKNKFLGKCSYGRQPWIRPAMEYERMVEKRINFFFGNRLWYIYHGKYCELLCCFRWQERHATQNIFLS